MFHPFKKFPLSPLHLCYTALYSTVPQRSRSVVSQTPPGHGGTSVRKGVGVPLSSPGVTGRGSSHISFAVSPELHLRPTASLLWAGGVCWQHPTAGVQAAGSPAWYGVSQGKHSLSPTGSEGIEGRSFTQVRPALKTSLSENKNKNKNQSFQP